MIRIIIADDHPVIRGGLKAMLEKNTSFKVVGEAVNGQELVDLAGKVDFDVICTDISMPVMDGIEATKQLIKKNPKVRVVCLSMHEQTDYIKKMMDAGAVGYIFKDSPK